MFYKTSVSVSAYNREQAIGTEHFNEINWLLIDQRFKQCLSTSVFRFFPEMCPQYMNEIYETTNQNNTVTRNSSLKLFQLLTAKALSQSSVVFREKTLGKSLEKNLASNMKGLLANLY